MCSFTSLKRTSLLASRSSRSGTRRGYQPAFGWVVVRAALTCGQTGLSRTERDRLLERIEELLGDSPKARITREIVQSLPVADEDDTRPSADESTV